MHAVRLQFAEVAGLTPSDLLFVGELLDMRPDYEGWRTAADAVLASLAYRLLVDERDLQTLRRAVNGIRTSVRLSFEGVPVGLPVHSVEDRSTLAGRLVIQNCQFAGWLSKHLDERHAYRCVQSVEDLADDGVHRVTREGQVQRGKSGAHGGNTQRRIGFTNDHRRAEVEADIKTFESQINVIEGKLDTIEAQENQLRQQKDAWVEVSTTTWADIDIAAIDASISEWKEVLAEIVIESPELDALAGQRINLKTEIDDTFEKAILAKNKVEQFEDEHETLTAQVEPLRQLIDALKSDDTIRLTDEQQVHLDTKANSFVDWDGRGATFGAVINSIRVEIGAELSGAQARMDAAANRLTSAFMLFHTQWPDPSRGTGLLSYDDYHGILADLCANGLAAQRQNWSRKVIEYSGDRLSVLNNSYGLAKDEIAERLGPVRRILRKVPFGSREGATLDIAVLHRRPESVSVFQRRLRKLAEGTMIPLMDDAAAEAKFASIREVLAVIRPKSPERDLLLDVRRHLKVTAQVLDGEGLAVAAYDHITDKSGGEAQMITAFICGAALRYQLGDEDREHPRFAPVVLDEAFIKADGRYTMLAVKAWQTLGFQLVIGAPEDKFNAIEPAVGLVIGVTKDREEHSYAIPAPRKPKINGA